VEAAPHQLGGEQRGVEQQPADAPGPPPRQRAGDRGAEAEPAEVEALETEVVEERLHCCGERVAGVRAVQRRRGPEAGQVGDHQRAPRRQLGEPGLEVLRRPEEAVTEDQRRPAPAGEIAQAAAADVEERLVHGA